MPEDSGLDLAPAEDAPTSDARAALFASKPSTASAAAAAASGDADAPPTYKAALQDEGKGSGAAAASAPPAYDGAEGAAADQDASAASAAVSRIPPFRIHPTHPSSAVRQCSSTPPWTTPRELGHPGQYQLIRYGSRLPVLKELILSLGPR